jgi:hypothetical protein
LKQQ